jgi:hypothetical protein
MQTLSVPLLQLFLLISEPKLVRSFSFSADAPRTAPSRSYAFSQPRQHRGLRHGSERLRSLEARKTLGLLTFDLDDSLYPVEVVVEEANAAFARAMGHYGFDNIEPTSITEACKQIREELPPEEGLALTHTEVRRRAIRREMENVIYKRKLKETADDWATPVSDLSPIVKNFARKYVRRTGKMLIGFDGSLVLRGIAPLAVRSVTTGGRRKPCRAGSFRPC